MRNEFVIILTATDSRESAQKIARELVERRLAACVKIVPGIESVFRWQGKVEVAQEFLLLIQSGDERYAAVESAIRDLHAYDLPECVMLRVERGSAEYLAWLGESVG